MKTAPASTPHNHKPALLLRRADQLMVAVLVAAALVAMVVDWFASGGHRGQLIEIDRATPLRVPFVVDINQADWPELAQLPGVGEVLARRIVELREERGGYVDNEELLEVRGIGPRTLARMEPYLMPMPSSSAVVGRLPTIGGQPVAPVVP